MRVVDCVWNVMAHAQKPDFVFLRKGRVHLNGQGTQFILLLAAEVCASAVLILDSQNSEVVWRTLANHSIRQFPLHFPSRTSPGAITFQLDSTSGMILLYVRRTFVLTLSTGMRCERKWINLTTLETSYESGNSSRYRDKLLTEHWISIPDQARSFPRPKTCNWVLW